MFLDDFDDFGAFLIFVKENRVFTKPNVYRGLMGVK